MCWTDCLQLAYCPNSGAYLFLSLRPLLCPVRVFSFFPYISLLISSSIGSTCSTRSSTVRSALPQDAAQNDLISMPKIGQTQGGHGARGHGHGRAQGSGRGGRRVCWSYC